LGQCRTDEPAGGDRQPDRAPQGILLELLDLLERAAMIEAAVCHSGSDLIEPAHRVQVDRTGLDAQHVRLLIGN
jgi:hypothetical protein